MAVLADMAHVMMTAGIHATGNVEIQFADVVLVVEVFEALLNRFRNRKGFRIGKRAKVAAGAADDVADQADIRRGEAGCFRFLPQREQIALFDVGQNQILFMGHAQFAKAEFVGPVGHLLHLRIGQIAGRNAQGLQR